jgi:uncharacterized protein YecT (DUF1311 family)
MRVLPLALALAMVSGRAFAGTDIIATCHKDCEARTNSNPEYKGCVARAADKADAALNQAYKVMQDKIRAAAKERGQPADTHLEDLRASQKYWITFRDANCTLEDNVAFGGTAIGGNYSSCLCALSSQCIDDFERMQKDVGRALRLGQGRHRRLKPQKKLVYYPSNS